jgi:pimeloyl-ACP methyl ester carboxylesterase
MRQTFKNVVQASLVEDMKQVAVPTLLLWGESDGIVPLSIAKRMQSIINFSELVSVPNSDHGVPYKFPQEFAVCVDEFIQKLEYNE